VIDSGVAPGDRVIVEGMQKVSHGMIVAPKPAPPELAGAPPAQTAAATTAPPEPAAPRVPQGDAERRVPAQNLPADRSPSAEKAGT